MTTFDLIFILVGSAIAIGCLINIIYSIVKFRQRNIDIYLAERNQRKENYLNGRK